MKKIGLREKSSFIYFQIAAGFKQTHSLFYCGLAADAAETTWNSRNGENFDSTASSVIFLFSWTEVACILKWSGTSCYGCLFKQCFGTDFWVKIGRWINFTCGQDEKKSFEIERKGDLSVHWSIFTFPLSLTVFSSSQLITFRGSEKIRMHLQKTSIPWQLIFN